VSAPADEPAGLATRTDYRKPICVIGPNPAIDYTLEVPDFAAGGVNRTGSVIRIAGGKPVNVARTLVRLGESPLLVAPLGGDSGQVISEATAELGIRLWSTPVREPTRTAVIVADSTNRSYTVINEHGPRLDTREAESYRELSRAAVRLACLVLASGSLPPGLDPDFYADLAHEARASEVPFILDTSGDPLRHALDAQPWALKVNGEEVDAVTGAQNHMAAMALLRERGIEHVVVTLGHDGSLYSGPDGTFAISALAIDPVNPTAAGDAFLAGLAASLSRGEGWLDALRHASAAAGLVAARLGPDIGAEHEVDRLADRITVHHAYHRTNPCTKNA